MRYPSPPTSQQINIGYTSKVKNVILGQVQYMLLVQCSVIYLFFFNFFFFFDTTLNRIQWISKVLHQEEKYLCCHNKLFILSIWVCSGRKLNQERIYDVLVPAKRKAESVLSTTCCKNKTDMIALCSHGHISNGPCQIPLPKTLNVRDNITKRKS